MQNNPTLSIVILSYNTKGLLRNCLQSLEKVKREIDFEVVVVDNASKDKSVEMVKRNFPSVKLVKNKSNLGFAVGNNKARSIVRGEYILFLNSDTVVHKKALKKTVKFLDKNKEAGAVTCKILLPNGKLDKDVRRSFITPWIGLTHIFLRLDRVFPKSKLFSQYWYGYISPDKTHEVDVLQGAFFLTRKKILDKVGWFDEDYFLDGEDIDLCWKIKEKDWKIYYYPEVSIIHYKGSSKGKAESGNKNKISLKDKLRFRLAGVDSMEIFYRKHVWNKYPLSLNIIVIVGIKLLKFVRIIKTLILG